jgi:hypothetical protein
MIFNCLYCEFKKSTTTVHLLEWLKFQIWCFFLTNPNMLLFHNQAIIFFGVYPNESITMSTQKTVL